MFYFTVALKIHLPCGRVCSKVHCEQNPLKEYSCFLQPNLLLVLWFVGMPPPVGPRPGMPPMTQAQPVTAPGILNRPPAPAASAPTPQPPVTKPLFPSAGQVRCLIAWNLLLHSSNCCCVNSVYSSLLRRPKK